MEEKIPMVLALYAVLTLLPLAGIVYIALYGSVTTVDGLFTSLILLAMSGIFALSAALEFRRGRVPVSSPVRSSQPGAAAVLSDGATQRGKVEQVLFFEANVGQPNKSVVILSNGTSASRTLVLDGDVRNALPVGHKVEVTIRKESGRNVLVDVIYA